MTAQLPFGPLDQRTVHLCVDMQNLFAPGAPWSAPWFARVLPRIAELVQWQPQRTVFSRFMPPPSSASAAGTWQRFFKRWESLTLEHIDPVLLELHPDLARHVPPARVIDKPHYSPFHATGLAAQWREQGIDTVVVSGTETDVCVAASVLDAVDCGFRVVVARDAICSSNDATHDALMRVYHERFSHQVEAADVETILQAWPRA
jgi:nicotinamidase-related amidase